MSLRLKAEWLWELIPSVTPSWNVLPTFWNFSRSEKSLELWTGAREYRHVLPLADYHTLQWLDCTVWWMDYTVQYCSGQYTSWGDCTVQYSEWNVQYSTVSGLYSRVQWVDCTVQYNEWTVGPYTFGFFACRCWRTPPQSVARELPLLTNTPIWTYPYMGIPLYGHRPAHALIWS